MGKADLAQEKRIMLFEEVCGTWTERRLTQEEAAELLGVCPRTFRRWAERWEEDGIDGLRDRRLAGASHRAAPVDEVMRMVDRYRTRHEGWSVRHFYSWHRRDGGERSYGWVKDKLKEAGAVPKAKGRGRRRVRRSCPARRVRGLLPAVAGQRANPTKNLASAGKAVKIGCPLTNAFCKLRRSSTTMQGRRGAEGLHHLERCPPSR